MSIDPIKPIGAFIENTIRPLLEELHWFFEECEKKGIAITEDNLKSVIQHVCRCHFRTCVINLIQSVVVCLILCITWLITQNCL